MVNKYVGSRYVPIYIGIHDETIEYEPLSIVSNTEKTETYTSKQHVPKGVSLDNETYWAQSGFSNADLQIDVDSAGYLSTDSSDLEIEKTKGGYLITLNASNSFDCGGEFGEAYTLNTLYDVGRYVINPSLCTGIPSELKDISNPAELVISEYTKKDEEIFYQYQKITAYDSDNAASFIRFHDGKNWSDWKMIGGNGGGSYTLPIATSETLGGVKIGDGINVTDDGTISVSGGGGSVTSDWVDVSNDISVVSNRASIKHAYLNESVGILDISFVTQNYQADFSTAKIVSLTNQTIFQFSKLNDNNWVVADAENSAKTIEQYCIGVGRYNITPAVYYIVEFSLTYNQSFTRLDNSQIDVITTNSSVSTSNVVAPVHIIIPLKKA